VWRAEGEDGALALIQGVGAREYQVAIRWVRLDDLRAGDPAIPAASLAELAAGNEVVRVGPGPSGDDYLFTYVPVPIEGASKGALELTESLDAQHRYVRGTILRTAITTAALSAACGIVATALGLWLIGRPMRSLVEQARRVGRGDFAGRLDLQQKDEIGELALEMNAMCLQLADAHDRIAAETARRITALEQLRHADRLATVGQLASGVAHELGTPLNVVHARARIIAGEPSSDPETARGARIIADQAERMTQIIRQLLDFARRREPKRQSHDVAEIVRHTLAVLAPLADKKGVTTALTVAEGQSTVVHVDAGQIQQVLTNLVVNGIQAMASGGRLTVELRTERAQPPPEHGKPEGDYLRVAVRDDGPGIPAGVIERVSEPFFTTKGVGEGTGLGLSVSYGIVMDHGGWLAVETEEGKGSTFSAYLPQAAGE
jgi:signal transduction histidine kinase